MGVTRAIVNVAGVGSVGSVLTTRPYYRSSYVFVYPKSANLDGLRSLVLADGVQWDELAKALVAIAVVGAISMAMCFAALRGRTARG